MDGSPLTLAQSHALKAAKASTPAVIIHEHELAAGQFATAAKGIDDTSEAFRTLKLLEQHHEKLAQILNFKTSQNATSTPDAVTDTKSQSQSQSQTSRSSEPKKAQDASPYRSQTQSLPAAHRPPRDVSSSIASNLASARGIPSNRQRRSGQASSPAVASAHVEGKIVNPQRRSRLGEQTSKAASLPASEKMSLSPNTKTQPPTKTPLPSEPSTTQATKPDEPFQRFYSTFESLFSKLSAPLAFAGLPLNPEEPSQLEKVTPKKLAKPERATADPEYSHLFSKAAFKAVREESGNHFGPAESFYVVPTTGGTMPYASMLARGAHIPGLVDRDGMRKSDDLDEFVDARETPGPPSPTLIRGGKKASANAGTKTMEELQLENETLRALVDNFSRRLRDFEMGAQTSSMVLHQSIRANLRQSPGSSVAGDAKVEKLEEQVKEARKEMERMGKENEKLKGVVGRYREKWDSLKDSARKRREGSGGGKGDEA